MNINQILLSNKKNLDEDNFKSIFIGSEVLDDVIEVVEEDRLGDIFEKINSSFYDLGIIINSSYLGQVYYFNKDKNIIYIYLPTYIEDKRKYIINVYLRAISEAKITASNNEKENYLFNQRMKYHLSNLNIQVSDFAVIQENHRKESKCVNNINIFLNEKPESVVEKLSQADNICFRCYDSLPNNIKENYIDILNF